MQRHGDLLHLVPVPVEKLPRVKVQTTKERLRVGGDARRRVLGELHVDAVAAARARTSSLLRDRAAEADHRQVDGRDQLVALLREAQLAGVAVRGEGKARRDLDAAYDAAASQRDDGVGAMATSSRTGVTAS